MTKVTGKRVRVGRVVSGPTPLPFYLHFVPGFLSGLGLYLRESRLPALLPLRRT